MVRTAIVLIDRETALVTVVRPEYAPPELRGHGRPSRVVTGESSSTVPGLIRSNSSAGPYAATGL